MDVFSLPSYLMPDNQAIQLFDYKVLETHLKSKVNLTKNTFSFLLEGSKEVITDHHPISIQNSEFLIMKSGHCLMTENLSSSKNIYRSMLLFFSDEMIFDFIKKYDFRSSTDYPSGPFEVCQYDAFLNSFVESLKGIQQMEPLIQAQLLKVKFEEVMLYLVEKKGVDFLHFLTKNTEKQSRDLIKVVENNLLNKLSLRELAFLCNMSVSTFKREFEKQYKNSPIKWFQDKRLEHSAFLLRSRSKRPSEIYEEVGYENLSNYIHAFRVKFGKTPKQYQKQE